MDEDLRATKRAFENDPTDETAARRYKQALLRAGRDEEVRWLFQMKFACPKTWDQLAPTSRADVRSCDECHEEVFFAPDPATLAEHVRAGRCVATPASLVAPKANELSKDDALVPTPGPCLVGGGSTDADTWLQGASSHVFRAGKGRWAPLRRDADDVLVVAVAEPQPELARVSPGARTVLVSKEELQRIVVAYPRAPLVLGRLA